MIDPEKIDLINRCLSRDERILGAYLMGSAVSGCMRPGSDVDLAILTSQDVYLSSLQRLELAAEISFQTGLSMDVGEISSRNLVYSKEAVLRGRRIYVRDEPEADLKISYILGMYVVFNESRQEVLDAYRSG